MQKCCKNMNRDNNKYLPLKKITSLIQLIGFLHIYNTQYTLLYSLGKYYIIEKKRKEETFSFPGRQHFEHIISYEYIYLYRVIH